MNLLNNCKIDFVNAAISLANNTDDNSSILDMAGYDGVIFMTTITDSVSGGIATLTVQESAANSDTAMAAIAGAAATVTSAANDDLNSRLLIVDCYRPVERYVQGTLTSATQNIAFGETIAIRYNGRKCPVSQSSTTVAASTSIVGS